MIDFLKEFKWALLCAAICVFIVNYQFYGWGEGWNTPEAISCCFDFLLVVLVGYIAHSPENVFDRFL